MSKIITNKELLNSTVEMIKKYDAFKNSTSGYGGVYDNVNKINFTANNALTPQEEENLYRYDWISRQIIDVYPTDALKQWIEFTDNESHDKLDDKIEEFNLKDKLHKALVLARIYGGSVMLLATKDGSSPLHKMKPNAEITSINVLDRHQLEIIQDYNDPFRPNFGDPQYYRLNIINRNASYINPNKSVAEKLNTVVHESRLIRINGNFLPDTLKIINNGWHDSVLNSINTALQQAGTSLQSGAQLLQDFVTKILKIPNLADLIAAEKYETIEYRVRYALGNISQSGIALIGADEEFNKIQTPITGLVDLLDKYIDQVCGSGKVPRARLFAQALGTLAGATETTRAYYDDLATYQDNKIKPVLRKILKHFNGGVVPNFKFHPIWVPTEKETADIHKTKAESDSMYIDRQVLSPEEVALSRFGNTGYRLETTLLKNTIRELSDDSERKTGTDKDTPEDNT